MTSKHYYAKEHIFDSRGGDNDKKINLLAGPGKSLNFESSLSINGFIQYLYSVDDLPPSINGVITLVPNKTYYFLNEVDLLGSRILCLANNVIRGLSSEVSKITSTGLDPGTALFTSTETIIFKDITINDVGTAFNLLASSGKIADWVSFNLINIPNIGTIKDYENVIVNDSAWLNSSGCIFDGLNGTIAFVNCLLTNFHGTTTITVLDTCIISRRFKIVESSLVVSGTGIGINFNNLTTVPNQGYVLTSVNFSGSGTYQVGVDSQDNKALFFKCLGISNSRSIASYSIGSPILTPLILNVWTKILGTTLPNPDNSKFSASDNSVIYTGAITQIFTLSYTVSLFGSNNKVIEIGVSINDNDPKPSSISTGTLDSGGKISSQSMNFFEELKTNDKLELWVRNITDSTDITVDTLSALLTAPF